MNYGETTYSFDHNPTLHKRKVPKLAFSTDVKTSSNYYNHTTPLMPFFAQMPHSSSGALSQMEVDGTVECHPQIDANPRLKCSLGTHLEMAYSHECHSLDPAHPTLLSALRVDSTEDLTVKLSSSNEQYPSSSQCTSLRNTHSFLFPASSVYPSPPQSSIASPLEVSTLLPVQPSPSLPLYQPRPTRRISIISLSRLASEAEEMENSSRRRDNLRKGGLDVGSRNVHYSSHHRQLPYSRAEWGKQAPRKGFMTERFIR